ncbi:MAG: threonine/serine exporter family protein [Enterocloster sp.]
MVFSTGIFVSLDNSRGEAMTLVRRVDERSTNLGRIYRVNEVSRKLCSQAHDPIRKHMRSWRRSGQGASMKNGSRP